MNTPKTNRLHICFFGRTNVGKSSIINFISNQDVAIVSAIAGTTTDCVEKTMELAQLGPVVLIDTPGIDDNSDLGIERQKRTDAVLHRCDFAFLIIEPNIWTDFENSIIKKIKFFEIKYAIIINKIDLETTQLNSFINSLNEVQDKKDILTVSTKLSNRVFFISEVIKIIKGKLNVSSETNLFEGLIERKDVCLFITPIDSGTPKGRMILPQVQALRTILDLNAEAIFVQVDEYLDAISKLKNPPKLVVTDSQVVKKVIELSDEQQAITTFSILLARMKGDLRTEILGTRELLKIKETDNILIVEACSHHSQKDDISRVLIPKLFENKFNFHPKIDYWNGNNFPEKLEKYNYIIHCGACMITNTEKQNRVKISKLHSIPFSNFGLVIAFLNGYLERTIQPFNLQL